MSKKASKKSPPAKSDSKSKVKTKTGSNQPKDKNLTTSLEFKISIVLAAIAMVANVLIYFLAINPTYDIIDNTSTADISSTLDKSERVTGILTPLILVALVLSVVALVIGIIKHVKAKSKIKS